MRIFLNRTFLFIAIILTAALIAAAQAPAEKKAQKYTISGYLTDASSGELVIGASVIIKELMKGATTNQYGFYSITIPEGKYHLIISFLGFENIEQEINLDKNLRMRPSLKTRAYTTGEVVIEAERSKNVESAEMGTMELDVEKIKTIPAFLGEVDVLKTLQLLPGIQSAGEGYSGLYVRGGGPDQNLILLDEATVYHSGHLFGFFSVFNADAVKNVELFKGHIPANYGGRIASVVDVTMKEGNSRKYQVDGGIGLISSRLTIQGPIKKDTCSFIISARRTYIDVLLKPFISSVARFSGSGYYFYDLNAKLNYRLSEKNRFYLSGYFGRDVFTFSNNKTGFKVDIPWGNTTVTTRWNHLFSNKLFSNMMLIYSNYSFEFGAEQSQYELRLNSGITDLTAKTDLTWFPTILHKVKFGFQYSFHTYVPSSFSGRAGKVSLTPAQTVRQYAHIASFYANDEFDIGDRLKINVGARLTWFQHTGPFSRFIKNEYGVIKDTVVYTAGQSVKSYLTPEPRISARYSLNSKSSLKTSFVMNYQHIHLASISTVSLPTDVWIPSSDVVKPQEGYQYSIGYYRNFLDDNYETSVEIYYRSMKNQVEYKEGADPQENVNDNPDNSLTFGDGWAYGGELFINKRFGKTTGWIGYTLAWTQRSFPEIMNGKTFFARYDRRHDLSIVVTHLLNPAWTFSGTFIFATGSTITLPEQRIMIEDKIVNLYGDRNGYRMEPYHRLDIAATFYPSRRKKKLNKNKERKGLLKNHESSWTFAVFNVYNRANPYFIYFDNEGDITAGTLKITAYQVSLFPLLPSVTWNFKF